MGYQMIQYNKSVVYTLTIFLSAYLLFLIQPMVGKSLLPILGGTPSIWNTAMVFFQVLLLAGYLYAHILTRIKNLRTQLIIHGLVIIAAFITLPMATSFIPPTDEKSPLLWQISTMIEMIGLPFFVLSTSAPLLQKWFSLSNHPNAHNPYFLYSASNIGSLLALILYPILIERFLPLPQQTSFFQIGFGALGVCVLLCGLSIQKSVAEIKSETDESLPPTLKQMGIWLFLSFVPSSLMLGFTSFVTTDIGSSPLFWIIPLTLYILSFILAFAVQKIFTIQQIKVVFLILFFITNTILNALWLYYDMTEVVIAHGFLFFVIALMCHQQLDSLKPSPKYLTQFFLIMSLGGALGGIFNALISPLIFLRPYEYMLVSALALLCWGIGQKHKYIILLGCFLMTINPVIPWETADKKIVYISRNYFGNLIVRDTDTIRTLAHGTTIHGSQAIDEKLKLTPTTYYHFKTAIAESLSEAKYKKENVEAIVLGLGTGALSCNFTPTDNLTFIEIDPDIIKIAKDRNLFTYVDDCKVPVKIIQGDARLKINDQPNGKFDYILVDVFSGDNIPIHLITAEATELYLKKMKKDGLLAFHISNRYMNLATEVGLIAKSLNVNAYHKISEGGKIIGSEINYFPTEVIILTNNTIHSHNLEKKGWKKIDLKDDNSHPWTDTYANPLRALFSK
jgi:spermidine synthase